MILLKLPPGIYELVDIKRTIRQRLVDFIYELNDIEKTGNLNFTDSKIDFSIEADTISIKSILTITNPIHFNS